MIDRMLTTLLGTKCNWRYAATLWMALLLTCFTVVSAGNTGQNGFPRESIRIVMDDNYPPYAFRAGDGTLTGILVDQWALWEKKTGIHVQIDAMNWAEALRRMEAREYDVIDTIFENEYRKTLYDFSPPYALIDVSLFFSKELSGIQGPKDLAGFVVGAKKGDNSIEILKAANVSHFLLFDNYEEVIAAARDGKIKVFTVDKPPAMYYLIKMGIQDQFRESEPIDKGEFRRAVHKGDAALLGDLQRGFDAISKREYQDIERRWYGGPIITKREFTIAAIIAAISVSILSLLLLWVWMLRRSVRLRTVELTKSQEVIGESEERFRTIFEKASDGVIVFSSEGKILDVNEVFAQMHGRNREELRGLTITDISGPDTNDLVPERMRRLMAGETLKVELAQIHKDGHVFTTEATANLVTFAGQPAILSSHRDITERNRNMEEILSARRFNELIIQSVHEGVVVYGPDLRHQVWNSFMENLSGVPASEVLGKLPLEAFPFLQGTGLMERIDKVFSGESVNPIDMPFEVPRTGRAGWTANNLAPIYSPEGKIIGVIATVVDITERKRSELALAEGERRFRAIFEKAIDGIVMFSPDGLILAANEAFAQMHGYTKEEMRHLSLKDLDTHETAVAAPERLRRLMAGEVLAIEVEQVRKDGSTYRAEATASTVQLDGKPVILSFHRDITDRKRAEAERKKLQAQLHHAQKMESLGTLAGGIAHDMNNVLGAILGLASAHIGTQPYGSPLHKALDTICKATERGGKMVKSLLSFARQSPAEEHELDVNEVLQEVVHLLERTTLTKIRLLLDLASDLRPIRGDASALNSTFMNLCVNAVDAMQEKGTLTLHTLNLGHDWIEVVIEDTGIGMAKEILDKALDPFFTTKEVGKGTGLGLTMAYSTVQAHRGQMEIHSGLGQGTRVIMRFPTCEAGGSASESTTDAQARTSDRALKVLLVDDDELIQSSLQAILEALAHDVSTAPCGEDALAMIEAGYKPDVVILDMNMPGLSGVGTLPRLQELLPKVPIILSTGRTDQTALNLASTHRGVTLLPKPFGLRELKNHLGTLGFQ